MPEIEAKLLLERQEQVDEVLRTLAELGHSVEEVRSESIVDTYFDTPDRLISRAGWAYRCRERGDDRKLTLKSLGTGEGAVFVREEIEQSLRTGAGTLDRLPSGPVQERLDPIVNGHPRRKLFRVTNRRTSYEVRASDAAATSIELAVDRAEIAADRKGYGPMCFMELELELNAGDTATLASLVRILGERVGLVDARVSKFERGLRVAGIDGPAEAGEEGDSEIGTDASMLDLAYAQIGRQLGALRLHQPHAWEGIDSKGVHQMRIATRRLRAGLRVFRKLFPADDVLRFGAALRWLAGALGDVRDADVYRENFGKYARALPDADVRALEPFQQQLRLNWEEARARLREALGSRRYEGLIADLEQFTAAGPSSAARQRFGGLNAGDGAEQHINRAATRMLERGRRLRASATDEELHALRIRGKRFRYLLEFFDGLHVQDLRKPIKACKTLQDVLGDYHDDVVACERVRAYAHAVPLRAASRGELLALGRLEQSQAQHGARARARFSRGWRKFEGAVSPLA